MHAYEVRLNTTPEQHRRLKELQATFASACNAMAPVVQQSRCWNRVALHHLVYRWLRESYPQLGSQMVCNAIYSVCRTARLLFQDPSSPYFAGKIKGEQLPLLKFENSSPVFFDRHTLSLKNGQMSMYTLDGRIKFDVTLSASQIRSFAQHKLMELVLKSDESDQFALKFVFEAALETSTAQRTPDLTVAATPHLESAK